jgi:hypothetical protein
MTDADESSDDLKQRLLVEVARDPAPTRRGARMRNAVLMATAVGVPLWIWYDAGGVRLQQRPLWFVLGNVLGWVVVAAWALWGTLSRGGSMVGRSRRWLDIVVIAAPALLFAWTILWDLVDTNTFYPWRGRIGFKCLRLTLLMGAWPIVALVLMRRGSDPVHPGATGAAIGAAIGCATAVLLDLWCPISDPAHVLVGHVTPLVLLSLGGLALGAWLLDLRRRPSALVLLVFYVVGMIALYAFAPT